MAISFTDGLEFLYYHAIFQVLFTYIEGFLKENNQEFKGRNWIFKVYHGMPNYIFPTKF